LTTLFYSIAVKDKPERLYTWKFCEFLQSNTFTRSNSKSRHFCNCIGRCFAFMIYVILSTLNW